MMFVFRRESSFWAIVIAVGGLLAFATSAAATREGTGTGTGTGEQDRKEAAPAPVVQYANAVVEWIRNTPGGFWHEKLEFAAPEGSLALFATKDFLEDEVLFTIPQECVIDSEDSEDVCDTARNLYQELKLGQKSEYGPYMEYLKETQPPPGKLPSAWSLRGKKLLLELIQCDKHTGLSVLPPNGVVQYDFADDCVYSDDHDESTLISNPQQNHAYMLALQRSWGELLIPGYDMISHRNGHSFNTKTNHSVFDRDHDISVLATQPIFANEEIHTSYNLCEDCVGKTKPLEYGTPEIFRDTGLLEQYPQRWIFNTTTEYGVKFNLDQREDTGELYVTWLTNSTLTEKDVTFLETQLERLETFNTTKLSTKPKKVPELEFAKLKFFLESMTTAIKEALGAHCNAGNCGAVNTTYNMLLPQEDELPYSDFTCDHGLSFPDYTHYPEISSHYQTLLFFEDLSNNDTCLDLDGTIQTCSNYRAHYHEPAVHYAARYIEKVERVLWVGGGDSMLLHEVLKYDSLKLVVGLEIDQQVTRHSFRMFGTQPHWDNPKVQWWYGDAAKSLMMLPKEYFGTFDLVLVDLSETIMSVTVTDNLDIFGALSLLLKPEGIIEKNEIYFEEFTKLFEHTVNIHYYDIPTICSQALVYGSYGLDFLTATPKDHSIPGLTLDMMKDTSRFEYWHDYRKNHTSSQAHCKSAHGGEDDEPATEQSQSPGILMILEAEDSTVALSSASAVSDLVSKTLQEQGLSVMDHMIIDESDDAEGKSIVVIICAEGYVVARSWVREKYVAFDVHLWSNFGLQESIKHALLAAVGNPGGKTSSSYRIVAGGMFGKPTWRDDQKNRGPQRTQQCGSHHDNKDNDKESSVTGLDNTTTQKILQLSMPLVNGSKKMNALVICGSSEDDCEALETVRNMPNVKKVLAVYTCPEVEGINEFMGDALKRMEKCQKYVGYNIQEYIDSYDAFGVIAVDANATFAMGQIIHSLFDEEDEGRAEDWLDDKVAIFATIQDTSEEWRRVLLERFRHDILVNEPLFRAEVLFNSSDASMELGILSFGDEDFVQNLVDCIKVIEDQTGLVSDTRNILGGLHTFQSDFVPTHFGVHKDYEQSSPLEQYMSQKPMAAQLVIQLEMQTQDEMKRAAMQRQQTIAVGDLVAVRLNEDDHFNVGTVLNIVHGEDRAFTVKYDRDGVEEVVAGETIIKNSDSETLRILETETEFSTESLTVKKVHEAFEESVEQVTTRDRETNLVLPTSKVQIHKFEDVGDGSLHVAVWSGGCAVGLWDGRKHVNFNIFTYKDDNFALADELVGHFKDKFPSMAIILRDEQPRGVGRVVNHHAHLPLDPVLNTRVTPKWAF